MPGWVPMPAENRAIELSEERGMDVPLSGSMRPLGERALTAPKPGHGRGVHLPNGAKIPALHPPKMRATPPHVPALKSPHMRGGGRKYYGE